MAKNKYINNLIRLLNPNGSKAETTPLNLFDQTIQNPHTLDIPNHQILITIPDGLTIVSQQTGEFGTTTKFSDGTIIFVPTQQQIQLNYYNVISSDNTVDIESSFDGDTTTFDLSANMPEGLTIISQLDYGGSIVTTFSDGTMIVVPKATPTYTHYSPNKSVIITQDDINHTVTYEVAKTETPTQTDHITSVIESDYPIDGETEVTDLDYIQRAGQPITDTTSYWPIADIELAVYADTSITVTLQPDNPNAYSSLLQEATIDDGVYIKARLFGDIITNQPTTGKCMVTGTGNVISPSHYLIHRWMGESVPPEPLLIIGSTPENNQQELDLTTPFTFTLNTTDFDGVNEDILDGVLEIQKNGDTSKTVLSYDRFTKTDAQLASIGVILESDTEYTVKFLANKLVRSNGQTNQEYVINIKTKYVKPVNYTLDGNYFGSSSVWGQPVTIKDYDTQEIVEVIQIGDWASAEQYLPNVINTINGGFSNWEDTSPDYDFVLPKCTSIGDNFLIGARSFNSNVSAPVCKTIGHSFLGFIGGRNEIVPWTHNLDIPALESIGDSFLNNRSSFNQPLDLSNVTSIGGSFLSGCSSFNQPLDLSNITSISYYFLSGCSSFNQPLDLSNVTSISYYFLSGCSSFNQPLDLSNITSIGGSFLSNCSSFNQPLDLSNVTSIGGSFLSGCSSFNQPLDLSNVTSISGYFLYGCSSFNQPLDLSNVTSISYYFLSGCSSFADTITFGVLVLSAPSSFLSGTGATSGWNVVFIQPQTVTRLMYANFNTSASCNLTIPASSAGLNANSPKVWAYRTFKSITLT